MSLSIVCFVRDDKLMRSFSFVAFLSGYWQLSWFVLFNVESQNTAEWIAKLGYLGIIFLPLAILIFTQNLVDNKNQVIKKATIIVSIFLASVHIMSNFFIQGVDTHFFGFYPKAGPLLLLFLLVSVGITAYFLYIFFDAKFVKKNDIETFAVLGASLYPFSAIDILINYGYSFYPYGLFFLTGFILCNFSALVSERTNTIKELNAVLESKFEKAVVKIDSQKKEIVQKSKLASIGTMAAGVAHEIKNPLNFLKPTILKYGKVSRGMVEMIAEFESPTDASHEKIEGIKKKVRYPKFCRDLDFLEEQSSTLMGRILTITNGLTEYSRDASALERIPISLKEILKELQLEFNSESLIDKRAKISFHLESDCNLYGNKVSLIQVIANLIRNGFDSSEGEPHVNVHFSIDEEGVSIKVIDNGSGIPPEVLPKIFDPFFTTKDIGSGTGLGLSISSEIVSQHDGRLYVEKSDASGTVFCIDLPLYTPT